jgi:integrase
MVFAKATTRSGTFCENAILNLVKRFDPSLTAHGFRASFKTWARKERRYSFDAIEFALAHVPTKLEAAYMREDLLEERAELMQDWADFVTGGRDPASLRDQIDLEQ